MNPGRAGTAEVAAGARLAYLDGVVTRVRWTGIGDRAARVRSLLGIRPIDVGVTAVVAAIVELNVAVATGPHQKPLDAVAYTFGAVLVLPILLRNRWPLQALVACSVLLFVYYTVDRRDISPAPLLSLPLYDAALAGYLTWAIIIPAGYMAIGLFVVGASTHQGLLSLAAEFLPGVAVLGMAVLLGEVVRSRRALAAETARRLRMAEEEREAEAARRVAEERLRIARELHDTVAHSMATITVQAGSALHVLPAAGAGPDAAGLGPVSGQIRAALAAVRDTSKSALAEMRATLGQLRAGDAAETPAAAPGGLDRLQALRGAVEAAGLPICLTIEGDPVPLPDQTDHAAYRILQESLTNVLRHAGPEATAQVRICYEAGLLTLEVTDNGTGGQENSSVPAGGPGGCGGHGLAGMRERAAAAGGGLVARPRDGGGFEVRAHLPAGEAAAANGGAPAREAVTGLSQ
jgi:signal transduction histidine kinase